MERGKCDGQNDSNISTSHAGTGSLFEHLTIEIQGREGGGVGGGSISGWSVSRSI